LRTEKVGLNALASTSRIDDEDLQDGRADVHQVLANGRHAFGICKGRIDDNALAG
jgi:hypothetical protein